MLDNFRQIYNKELKRYKYEGGLTYFILNSREIRTFVFEVCKACVASQPVDAADGFRVCPNCGRTDMRVICQACGAHL